MRWAGFAVLALVAIALQMSLGAVLRVPLGGGASLGVDFLGVLAVLVALRCRAGIDVALAGWTLGFLIDLTTAAMPLGLYAVSFTVAAMAVFQLRSAFFLDNPLTQAMMGLAFCLVAHGPARFFVNLYVRSGAAPLGRELLQTLLIALCTAVFTPIGMRLLRPIDEWIMNRPTTRRR